MRRARSRPAPRRSARNGAPKPLSEEKLREAMLKVRKGATASFSVAQLAAVLDAIGGSVETLTVLAPFSGSPYLYSPEQALATLRKHVVAAPPAKPKLGGVYITSLGTERVTNEALVADYAGFVAVEGMRVTLGGASVEIVPEAYHAAGYVRYNLVEGKKSQRPSASVSDAVRWLLQNTDWVARVNRWLGVEEHVPADARTRDNTGTCAVCFRNIKLDAGRGRALPMMVLHGFRRPRWRGHTEGKCEGVDYPPFELSPAGTEHNLRSLRTFIAKLRRELDDVSGYDAERIRSNIRAAEGEAETHEKLVRYWVERPLPREGEMDRNLYAVGQKPARESERNGRRRR